MKVRLLLVIPVALLFLLPTGCGSSAHSREGAVVVMSDSPSRPGPPPHAPAHGYRCKYAGRDLVYDSRLHLYVVVGASDTYYWKGQYYRPQGTTWMAAVDMNGKWAPVSQGKLPPGLKGKKKAKRSPAVN